VTRASLNWSDPLAVSKWLGALRETIDDAAAVTEDMLRPPRDRELGPAIHRERATETTAQLRQLVDFATPPEPDHGDPAGNGGADRPH